jgi:Bacterial regulatory helix-turn-helix protein, lysR family
MPTPGIKLGALDFNLLVVFDAVMQERNVTRAGQRLGLSQPAMSHALTRLRHMLKDDLFIRSPKGMLPTRVLSNWLRQSDWRSMDCSIRWSPLILFQQKQQEIFGWQSTIIRRLFWSGRLLHGSQRSPPE